MSEHGDVTSGDPASGQWRNQSVLRFAQGQDPMIAATEAARRVLEAAVAVGMQAPPVDPIGLARLLGVSIHPRNDVADAEIFADPTATTKAEPGSVPALSALVPTDVPLLITYNPN